MSVRRSPRALLAAACALALSAGVLAASPARARDTPQVRTWTGADPTDNTNWRKAKNWSGEAVPVTGDAVVIDGTGRSVSISNVPDDRIFSAVSLLGGATLRWTEDGTRSGPLQAAVVTIDCGNLIGVEVQGLVSTVVTGSRFDDSKITVPLNAELVVRAPIPLVENGCTDYPDKAGTLTIFGTSEIDVSGRVHGDGRIVGGTSQPMMTVQRSGLLGLAAEKLTLDSLTTSIAGGIDGTGVVIAGTGRVITLVGASTSASTRFHLKPGAFARIAARPPAESGGQTTIAARGILRLGASARLQFGQGVVITGTPRFAGTGTVEITNPGRNSDVAPVIEGTVTTTPDTPMLITGNGRKEITPLNPGGPPAGRGQLLPEGSVTVRGSGEVRIAGQVSLKKGLTVPKGKANQPLFQAATCCSDPGQSLTLGGTTAVGKDATLRTRWLNIGLDGTIGGEGRLSSDLGSLFPQPGSKLTIKRAQLRGAGLVVAPGAALTNDSAIVLTNGGGLRSRVLCASADKVKGWCRGSLTGTGSISLQGATVAGNLTLGKDLRVAVLGPAQNSISDADSRVVIKGPTTLNGPLRMQELSRLTLAGTTLIKDNSVIDSGSCCSTRALVTIAKGAVTTVAPDAAPRWAYVDVSVAGDLKLAGRSFGLNAGVLRVVAGGLVDLGGGRITGPSTGPEIYVLKLGDLVGPGRIDGEVYSSGRTRMSRRGVLLVSGSLYLGRFSATTLTVGGTVAGSDRILVDGSLQLVSGILAVTIGSPLGTRRPILVESDTRTGAFVPFLPRGYRLAATPRQLILRRS